MCFLYNYLCMYVSPSSPFLLPFYHLPHSRQEPDTSTYATYTNGVEGSYWSPELEPHPFFLFYIISFPSPYQSTSNSCSPVFWTILVTYERMNCYLWMYQLWTFKPINGCSVGIMRAVEAPTSPVASWVGVTPRLLRSWPAGQPRQLLLLLLWGGSCVIITQVLQLYHNQHWTIKISVKWTDGNNYRPSLLFTI